MPVAGRKPKPRDQIRHRVPPVHEWAEIPDVPFMDGPRLPARAPSGPWPKLTRKWWAGVSHLPHAVLWHEADWQFALDTAVLVAVYHLGDLSLAREIRAREAVIGTTVDARRDLRIRYVPPVADDVTESPAVTAMARYRRNVTAEG